MNWLGISHSFFMAWMVVVLKVSIVLGLAWLVVVSLRRQSAAQRHRVWVAGILGALLLPFLASIVPPRYSASLDEAAARWGSQVAATVGLTSNSTPTATPRRRVPTHSRLPYLLGSIWSLVLLLLVLRLVAGLRRVRQVASGARPLSGAEWDAVTANLAAFLEVKSPVRLLLSARSSIVPVTWGLFRPTIVLPCDATEWSEQRRRIVLAHELAHVGRHDWVMQMCAELLCCIYWFNPLAWMSARQLRLESERACDDAVLSTSVPASDYASELLELVQTFSADCRTWAAALTFVRPSNLERRFEAMLSASVNRSRTSRANKLVIASIACCLLVPLAALSLPAQMSSGGAPRGWFLAGTKPDNYTTGIDPNVPYQGHGAAFLKAKPSATEGFGTLMQNFSAGQYAGQRVRLTAPVKSESVNDWAGLWMRVDQGASIVAFDNMQNRPIRGTRGWQDYSVVLDVPQNSTMISFGILLSKGGAVWISNVRFETVGTDVPVTGNPAPAVSKSPTNLNFDE